MIFRETTAYNVRQSLAQSASPISSLQALIHDLTILYILYPYIKPKHPCQQSGRSDKSTTLRLARNNYCRRAHVALARTHAGNIKAFRAGGVTISRV